MRLSLPSINAQLPLGRALSGLISPYLPRHIKEDVPKPHGSRFTFPAALLYLCQRREIFLPASLSPLIYPHLTFASTPLNQVLTRTSLNGAINQRLRQGTFPCLRSGEMEIGAEALTCKIPSAPHPQQLSSGGTPATLKSRGKTQVWSSRRGEGRHSAGKEMDQLSQGSRDLLQTTGAPEASRYHTHIVPNSGQGQWEGFLRRAGIKLFGEDIQKAPRY